MTFPLCFPSFLALCLPPQRFPHLNRLTSSPPFASSALFLTGCLPTYSQISCNNTSNLPCAQRRGVGKRAGSYSDVEMGVLGNFVAPFCTLLLHICTPPPRNSSHCSHSYSGLSFPAFFLRSTGHVTYQISAFRGVI